MIDDETFWYHYDTMMKHAKILDKIARQYFIDKALKKYEEMEEKNVED